MPHEKGLRESQHPIAKLSEVDIEQLRHLRAEGRTYRELAARFGVSASNIGWILRDHHWKHVPRLPITTEHLRGLPGLRQAACDAIIAAQPATVLHAFGFPMSGERRRPDFSLLASSPTPRAPSTAQCPRWRGSGGRRRVGRRRDGRSWAGLRRRWGRRRWEEDDGTRTAAGGALEALGGGLVPMRPPGRGVILMRDTQDADSVQVRASVVPVRHPWASPKDKAGDAAEFLENGGRNGRESASRSVASHLH